MNGCFDSDDDDAGLEALLEKQQRVKRQQTAFFSCSPRTSSSSIGSSTSQTPAESSLDGYSSTEVTCVPETPEHLLPSKKRTVAEPAVDCNPLHSKRICPSPILPMGNGFRHERVGNTNNSSDNKASESTSSGTVSGMPWQSKNSDRNHQSHPSVSSNSSSQPSSSSQESTTGTRPPRYQTRVARAGLHQMSSDSDDNNEWKDRTTESTSSNFDPTQQKSKRLNALPQRKGKLGYPNRQSRDAINSNVQAAASQHNSDPGTSTGNNRYSHRLKQRNAAATNNNSSGQSSGPSNEDSCSAQSLIQTTPKNRHMHRLRMNHNRQAAAGALSYSNNLASETNFPSNVPFRRDDPGRRAFQRAGHPLHGHRNQGNSGHHHHHHHRSPLLRGQDSSLSSLMSRHPDLFDSESTDESSELFTTSGSSPGRSRFPATPSPRNQQRDSYQFQPYGNIVVPENVVESPEGSEEPSVVFVSQSSLSPTTRNHRGEQGRFTGGRRRRSGRSTHLVPSGEALDILSGSPDPVAQVNQMEEDERMARVLQAEFDAEASNGHAHRMGQLYLSESDGDVLVDEEDVLSSPSSSSSNAEDGLSQYYLRYRGGRADSMTLDLASAARAPARGRRRNTTRAANANPAVVAPPVVPPRHHWHGSPVRGRRGRTRHNSDPLMLQFGRWLGWAILRNIDTDEGDDYEVLWNLAESMGDAVPRGLQRHEINRLPTHKYQAGAANDDTSGASTSANNNLLETRGATFTEAAKECRVCLCDYEANELLRVLPCFHEFHAACIDRWLKNNNTCPVCRAEVALDT